MSDLLASAFLPIMGIVMSPMPIAAVLFILMNSKNSRNGLAFLAGWVISFAFVMAAVLFIAGTRSFFDSYQNITPIVYIVMFGTGAFLLLFALYSWIRRPNINTPAKPPKWIRSVGDLTPVKSFGVACVLAGFSPKNGMLAVTSAIAISAISVNVGESIVFSILFLVLASLIIAIPVGYFTLLPKRARKAAAKVERIIYHSSTSTAVALALVGAIMIAYSLRYIVEVT